MQPRGTDALPLPPRANLEQYHNRAKSLLKACKSGDSAVVRAWARQWLESLAALTDGATTDLPGRSVERIRRLYRKEIDREVDKIERDARESGRDHGCLPCLTRRSSCTEGFMLSTPTTDKSGEGATPTEGGTVNGGVQ